MSPEEFEQKVCHIHAILEGKNAEVEWNAHINDPDNQTQKRQIDVLITNDNGKTIIECRHHKRPQKVKWIEEIYGRKVSLNALSAIAVSSSGFTKGAIIKAERLGIFTRNFSELTSKEIESWGKKIDTRLFYIKFEVFKLYIVQPQSIVTYKTKPGVSFKDQNGNDWRMESIFNMAVEKATELGFKHEWLRLQIFTKDLWIDHIKIDEVIVQCKYRRIEDKVSLPIVETYGSPGKDKLQKEVKIQKSNESMFEFYHTYDVVIPVIDLSATRVVKGAFLRSIKISFPEGTPTKGICILGYKGPIGNTMPFESYYIKKYGKKYNALLK